jgi:hypothetical protein
MMSSVMTEFVDLHDPFHLGEEAVDEVEVTSGDPGRGSNRLDFCEVVRV